MKREASSKSETESDSDDSFVGPSLSAVEKFPAKRIKRAEESIKIHEISIPIAATIKTGLDHTCVASAPRDPSVIISGSKQGVVTFWKFKEETKEQNSTVESVNFEIIKQFVAHKNKEIVSLIVDERGNRMASVAKDDKEVKIYDMSVLDMSHSLDLDFIPNYSGPCIGCWYFDSGIFSLILSESDSPKLHVLNVEDGIVNEIIQVHRYPVTCIAYNVKYHCFISVDIKGIIEYWDFKSKDIPKTLSFKFKSATDLFDLAKSKEATQCIKFSSNFEFFYLISYPNYILKIFEVNSGKLIKKIDIRIEDFSDLDQNMISKLKNNSNTTDESRLNLKRYRSAQLNYNDTKLYFSSLIGIIKIDLASSKIENIYGYEDVISDQEQFLYINLIKNHKAPSKEKIILDSSENLSEEIQDIFVATSLNSKKLYIFGARNKERKDIDLTNSKTFSKGRTATSTSSQKNKGANSIVCLHTSKGDIKLKLFDNITSNTVKNFLSLCKSNYYNNTIFHRVIKDFMIQGGDPLGDGTGGHSCDGGYIKDEFSPLLNHKKPFMLSMANSGPNTNGSQFFITTKSTPWLDNKHTVYGEAIDGFDVIKSIEESVVDENDRPVDDIYILSADVMEP